jgi:hypothetical protein
VRLHLVKKTGVLDGDHGLVSEGGDQLNLLIGEGLDRVTPQRDHPERNTLAKQRNNDYRAMAKLPGYGATYRISFRFGLKVSHMDDLSLNYAAPGNAAANGGYHVPNRSFHWPAMSDPRKLVIIESENGGVIAAAVSPRF